MSEMKNSAAGSAAVPGSENAAVSAAGKKDNPNLRNPYYIKMHRMGIWTTVISLIIFVSIPLITCLVFDIMPPLKSVIVATASLVAIFVPISIMEIFAEVPVMGSSYYLACVTGNILNLKLPAAMNALKITDSRQGTEKGDAVIGLAIAASSLVTVVMLALAVLLLVPIRPFLESETVQTAVSYVLPALFGCMSLTMFSNNVGGGVVIKGRLKAAIAPLILCAVLYFFVIPDLYESLEGFMILLCIPIVWFTSKKLYKKGKISVQLPGEGEAGGADGADAE